MTALMENTNTFVEEFERFQRSLGTNGHAWLTPVRKQAMQRFSELGFPSTRNEDWRFTNVAPITKLVFQRQQKPLKNVTAAQIQPYLFGEQHRITFVNGTYAPDLSCVIGLPNGIRLSNLSAAIKEAGDGVQKHLARHANYENDAFTALNTAFLEDGAFVQIPPNTVIEAPIHLLLISTDANQPAVVHPRALILVGDNSQVSLIESYIGLGSGDHFTNAVTEIVAGENAIVDHYRVQRENMATFHISTLHLYQGRDSNISSLSANIGGLLVRNNVHAILDGEGGDCTLNGIYMTTDRQHVDNHLRVEHAKPHCHSWEYYKGILDQHSKAVFSGRIIVHKDAQKTDAKQTNKNLLLSEDAQIDTKPQLEIYADDVKCTHGATIGQLNKDALFYLRARGIAEEAARNMMIYAFANESLEQVKIEAVRRQLENLLLERLPGGERLKEAI
jgi:Fe-S cluster assembly protein SufD